MNRAPDFDPITFEVVKNALGAIADEMALVVMRSAYSAVVRDSMDYSTALADREGSIVAQGLTLAVQLGSFPDCLALLVRDHRATTRPGDVYLFNDPYTSAGQHLPDLYVIKPLFVGAELAGWACTMAHHCDVGGIAPGSTAMHATDILQEGLCIPILKLYEAGEPNHTLFQIIGRNTRQPRYVLGDLRAQLAACAAGERGYLELLARYGIGPLQGYFAAMQAQAERMMRAIIAQIPDGTYSFTDYLDGIGDAPRPIAIKATVAVEGDSIAIDFAGSSPQVPAAINCPIAMVRSAAYCAIRCLSDTDIPNCEGYMRPVRITAPEGTIVNPRFPAACAARGVIGYRVFDAIMGALAEAVPGRVIAAGEGGPTLFSIGGSYRGEPFVLTEVMVGTWGARASQDGVEGISNPAANLSNQPIELIEAELPLEVVRYGLVPDSGGPGRHRGGLAFVREFRLLAEEAVCTLRSDRRVHRPYGIAGGMPGGGSMNVLVSNDVERVLPTMPMEAIALKRGDVFRHVSAGGGGYGDPAERDPSAVRDDVIDEKISADSARRDYGVVLAPNGHALDAAATKALRRERRAGGARRPAQARSASTPPPLVPRPLTEAQIAAFRSDGMLFPLPVMSGAEAAILLRQLEQLETTGGPKARQMLRHKGHIALPWLAELIRDPRILAPVANLLGPNLLCWTTNAFIKDPGDENYVSWHQDATYWGLGSDDIVTAWVAFTPSTPANGCMRMIPGSHRWPQQPHIDTYADRNLLTRGQEIAVAVDESRARDVVLAPGEMSLHHVMIAHSSGPNRGTDRRIGIAIRYISTRVWQSSGYADSATLVSGVDRYGHFRLEPRPRGENDAEALAFYEAATADAARLLYRPTR